MLPGLKDAAIAQAESLLARTGRRAVVYYVAGPDKWGRSGVFYVRDADDPRPYGAEVCYRAIPGKGGC